MANFTKFTNVSGDDLVVIPDTSTATDGDVLSYKDEEIKWAPAGGGSGGAKIVSKNADTYDTTIEPDQWGTYLYFRLKPKNTVDDFMDGIIKANGSILNININFDSANMNVSNLRVFISLKYKDNEVTRSYNSQAYSVSCFGVVGQTSSYVNTLTYIIPKLPQNIIDNFEEIEINMTSNSSNWSTSITAHIENINIYSFE